MSIKPCDYEVSAELLIQRMNLVDDDIEVYPTGIEHMFDKRTKNALTQCYDKTSLLLRTTPDFIVKRNNETYFVEAKQKTTTLEAIGLYYNKLKERNGIKVLYSFPLVTICASQIPMEVIEVPLKHKEDFDKYLKEYFVKEGCTFNYWSSNPTIGSGDPFVRIDEDDLKILAEDLI